VGRSGESDLVRCSFCGKNQKQVQKVIIARSGGAGICDDCVELCNQIIEEESHEDQKPPESSA
jgi:ATP-dependent Clp protease ATP-binding subunit ClpX